MPIYTLDIQKRLASEFWTNRYIVRGTNIASAVVTSELVVAQERTVHSTLVTFVNARVSDASTTEQYTIIPIGELGERNQTALLPLFNTLRLDFGASTGRPSRKYFRGVLGESDINGDAVLGFAEFTAFANGLLNLFAEVEGEDGIVDPQGTLLVSSDIYPFVQMRQLRRGKRRRATPIFQ